MLAAIFRVFLGFAMRLDLAFNLLLILNEFDVGNLNLGRWRDQEEKRQNQESYHAGHMKKIGATGGLRHLHDGVCVYMLSVQSSGMIISIPHGICHKCEKQAHQNQRCRATQIEAGHGTEQ